MDIETRIRSYIVGTIAEQKMRKAEMEANYQERLKDITANIAALERTLALFNASDCGVEKWEEFAVSPEEVRANTSTHKEALRYIASRTTDGTLHYAEARDLLMAAGMAKGQANNVASQVHRILSQGPEWEKVSLGRFRLISTAKV